MIAENFYDDDFVRDWTTAPFLVRSDTGNFLQPGELAGAGDASGYVVMDAVTNEPRAYIPRTELPTPPVLDGTYRIRLAHGGEVECRTVFRLLWEATAEYPLKKAEAITGIPEDRIREAARMFATVKPSCWYSWNGIEQNINATQTNRALCILYALTGNYDKPGGNVLLPHPPAKPVDGYEFLSAEADKKRLGFAERPLGPAGITARDTQAYEVYRAILTGKPYPIKALIGFGGNVVTSNAPSAVAREAISRLDFHVQVELFMTPTAELADIALPAASSWESWHAGLTIGPRGDKAYIQFRPAVVSPQHESRPDMQIIFELAKQLGVGDKFWNGDIEAGFSYQFAPAGVTLEQLRMNPGDTVIDLPMEYQKYRKKDDAGNFRGFPTPSKRVEIYSSLLKEHGHDPLPTWQAPLTLRLAQTAEADRYPLILTSSKLLEYCHSQHRSLPSLRKTVPHPFLEINPAKARELGLSDGDWVIVETPYAGITLQAKLTEGIADNVVCTQHGWWQACPELNLPGYDPYSLAGANANLLYPTEEIDPISGSVPIKGYPCNVRRA